MRTLCISDIHIDINKEYPVVEYLSKYVKKLGCGAVLIAGDISEYADSTIEAVREISKESGAVCFYVPGNHDMWKENNLDTKDDNDRIYEKYCNDENCVCGKTIKVGEHVLLGDIGWYDYSFGDRKYTFEDFEKMKYNERTWQDRIRNNWTRNNKEKNEEFLERIRENLEKSKSRKQFVMTHMLPIKDFCVPAENFEMWKYFNAFLGSEKYGELYKKYNVDYALCGHVHFRKNVEKDGIKYMCRCLNYSTEWRNNLDCMNQIIQAAEIIEL